MAPAEALGSGGWEEQKKNTGARRAEAAQREVLQQMCEANPLEGNERAGDQLVPAQRSFRSLNKDSFGIPFCNL